MFREIKTSEKLELNVKKEKYPYETIKAMVMTSQEVEDFWKNEFQSISKM